MSYHIEYIPQTPDRTKHSKGNGGKVGSGVHHIPKLDPITGLRLCHGNGCKIGGNNCFECKLPDCSWGKVITSKKIKRVTKANGSQFQ